MSKAYDPEQEIYDRGMVIDVRDDLPGDMMAATNGVDIVWLDSRLLQREVRSSLAHELAHCDIIAETPERFGGGGMYRCHSVENECDERAAVKLIDFDELIDAAKWAESIEDVADELVVTEKMVRARLRTLTKDEIKRFDREVGRGYAARLRGKPLQRKAPLKRR